VLYCRLTPDTCRVGGGPRRLLWLRNGASGSGSGDRNSGSTQYRSESGVSQGSQSGDKNDSGGPTNWMKKTLGKLPFRKASGSGSQDEDEDGHFRRTSRPLSSLFSKNDCACCKGRCKCCASCPCKQRTSKTGSGGNTGSGSGGGSGSKDVNEDADGGAGNNERGDSPEHRPKDSIGRDSGNESDDQPPNRDKGKGRATDAMETNSRASQPNESNVTGLTAREADASGNAPTEVPDNALTELPLKSSDGINDYSYIYSNPGGLLDSDSENDSAVKQDANDPNAPERNGDASLSTSKGKGTAGANSLELTKCQREKEKLASEVERASLAKKSSDLSFQCGASNDFTPTPLPPTPPQVLPPADEDRIFITQSTTFSRASNPMFAASAETRAAFIVHETEADAMERGEVNMVTSKLEFTEYDDEYFQSDLANYIPALRGGGGDSLYDLSSDYDSRRRAKKDIRKDSGQSPRPSHNSECSIPFLDRESVRRGKQPVGSESLSRPSESSRPLRKLCLERPTNFSLPFLKGDNVEAVERCADADPAPKSRIDASDECASKGQPSRGSLDSNISDLQLSPDHDYFKEPGQKVEGRQTSANEFLLRTKQTLHRPGTLCSIFYIRV
jgi:hypothetical protein